MIKHSALVDKEFQVRMNDIMRIKKILYEIFGRKSVSKLISKNIFWLSKFVARISIWGLLRTDTGKLLDHRLLYMAMTTSRFKFTEKVKYATIFLDVEGVWVACALGHMLTSFLISLDADDHSTIFQIVKLIHASRSIVELAGDERSLANSIGDAIIGTAITTYCINKMFPGYTDVMITALEETMKNENQDF